MAKVRPRTRETLARNLTVLMDRFGWTQRDLAALSGVSQRQISNILSQSTTCSIETADALAGAFKLNGWHLLMPNLPQDLAQAAGLRRLVEAYNGADAPTRDYLDSIADRELGNGKR